jgi:hypothetical protein
MGQLIHELWPAEGWKNPAAHSEQELSVEATENFPAAHPVQVLAPDSSPLLVTDPDPHAMHKTMLESVEYSPAAQAVQVVLPIKAPVSVIEPAWHGKQNVWPAEC